MAIVLCTAIPLLAGCRAEEQGRLTKFEPGVYKGKPDTPLSEEARAAIRGHGLTQSGAFGTGLRARVPGGGVSLPASSAPPAPAAGRGALNQRATRQGF
ncbi:MAG: hypothetical protein QNJ94_01450 [Alphaproteobacteria bacterium]|nr:hypothetical protein [Alphaproteobacteria bacterium]